MIFVSVPNLNFYKYKRKYCADPKNFSEDNFVRFKDRKISLIPPNSFALANSLETFSLLEILLWPSNIQK